MHGVDLIVLLIQASQGARRATKTVPWPKSQRRHESHRQGTARAKQTGGGGESQISQRETAGRRISNTAGTIRKKRGDPGYRRWKQQWPEKTGGETHIWHESRVT